MNPFSCDSTELILPIQVWSVWPHPLPEDAEPDLCFIDHALRRKLSPLSRAALKVAHDCTNQPDLRMVFASRHGDLERTTAMLKDLAIKETPSPTSFSMSVLNATAGVYSIINQNMAPAIAISAVESSFGFGLFEAYLQWKDDPVSPVLYVYADTPPPSIYDLPAAPPTPQAIALLLSQNSELEIICRISGDDSSPSLATQAQTFLECLNSKAPTIWYGEGRSWEWTYSEK